MGAISYSSGTFENCICNYADGETYSVDKPFEIVGINGAVFEGNFVYGLRDLDYGGYSTKTFVNEGNKLIPNFGDYGIERHWKENYSIELNDNYIAIGGEVPVETMAKIVYSAENLINCTCNYESGEMYSPDKPFEIVGINGAVFEGTFNYRCSDDYGDTWNETFINEGNKLVPNISDGNIKNTWEDSGDSGTTITLNDNYIAISGEVPVETNEFTNIYLITNAELSELSKARYTNIDGKLQDLGTFIVSLYKLPFILPSEIVVETKTDIMLGNNKVNVKSSLVNTDRLIIDFGDIEVPEKYHNIYDFINTTCILHLPYFDNIYIDVEYIVGQTINIKYVIDLYSGECSVNIYSSFLGDIMETRQSSIAQSIPFIQSNYNSVVGGLSSVNKNLIEKPFIEVVRNIPYNKSLNIFGNNVVEYGKIGDYQGYLQCDKIVLETNATNQEQEEIKNILRNGVFI